MPEVVRNEEPVSSLTKINIAEQIEYYFGDFNMMKDKFLKQEITKDDGWVPITVLLRFNRLAALSKDVDVIISSLQENPSSVVEVDAVGKRVRRNPDRPIPEHNEAWRSNVAQRTIYVKGFPLDSPLDDILKFMQTFGKIDNVFKRSYYDKALKEWKFKGSVFVAFPTKEDAEKFMSIKSVKFAGNEVIRKWQNDYIEEKKNERIESKLKAKESKNQLLQEQQAVIKKEMKKLPTGALLSLTGLTSEITINDLRNAGAQHEWDIAFIDYNMGESNAYIRLQEADSAKVALSKLKDNILNVKEVSIQTQLVDGEKEIELLNKMESEKQSRMLENFVRSKGKKNKSRKRNGKQDRATGSRNNTDHKNDLKNTTKNSKNSTMDVETAEAHSKISLGGGVKTEVVDSIDGKSAETKDDSAKPSESEENTLKRKTELTSPEAAKRTKSDDAD